MKLIGVIFVFIMAVASNSFAASDCRALADTVKPQFLKTLVEDYYPLMCSDNVLKLKTELLKSKINLENAYVVVIRHKAAPYVEIVPQKPRLMFKDNIYLPPRWAFHVFLVVDGMVLDMDYTDIPQALGLKTYMQLMWDKNKITDYVVQVKTLQEYSSQDTYGQFAKTEIFSATELVEKLKALSCTRWGAMELENF